MRSFPCAVADAKRCAAQIPSAKMLTFFRSNTFALDAEYSDLALLPAGTQQRIASFMVRGLRSDRFERS